MAGIFISHSSKDKQFVTRLAMDLVYKNISVWFDNWDLETGDSLIKNIYSSIDESSHLMIVLSKASVESKWVEKELIAALNKEDQLGRKFLIPIKTDDCQIPLSIADRLYIDFSESYLSALEDLIRYCKKQKIDEVKVQFEHELIPMTFTKGVNMQEIPFEKRVLSVAKKITNNTQFSENQFVLSFDETYFTLRRRFINRMENIANDPFYSPEFERGFFAYYEELHSLEESLIKGVILILQEGLINKNRYLDVTTCVRACHWFARIIRSKIYALMYMCQDPGREDVVEEQAEWHPNPLLSNFASAKFFNVERVSGISFGPNRYGPPSVNLWVDSNWKMIKDWEAIQSPLELKYYLDYEIKYKYIIPQMVEQRIRDSSRALLWKFGDYYVAIS